MKQPLLHEWSGIGLVALYLLLMTSPGCEDKRRHQATQYVTFSASQPALAADAPPLEVARAALACMVQAQRARRDGLGSEDRLKSYEEAIGRLLVLASRDEIHKSIINSKAYPADIKEETATTLIVESWLSTVAHYVDGIDLQSVRPKSTQSPNSTTITVRAVNPRDAELLKAVRQRVSPAEGPDGDKRLREAALKEGLNLPIETDIEIRLTRRKDGWRVSDLKLAVPLQLTTAPTQPAVAITSSAPVDAPNAP